MQHPVDKGCPSQSSGAAHVLATKAAQTAISENEKIFPVFAQRLGSTEPKEFMGTARKLSIWLSSEKAYYSAARLKIVELLEIALSTFTTTFAHHPAAAEISELLRQLIQAVLPFTHLFRENELQSRLQRVMFDTTASLSRASASTTHATVPSEGSVTVSAPSSTHAPPANLQPTKSPAPDYHVSAWRVQPFVSAEKANSVGSLHFRAHNPPEISPPSRIEVAPSFPLIVTNAPRISGESTSPTALFKPLPKRARRAELSEELIARDLDWFRSKQSGAINHDPHPPSSTAGEPSIPPPSNSPCSPKPSSSPKKKTARMVPSRRLPRRSLDADQTVESDVSVTSMPAPEPLAGQDGTSANPEDVSVQSDQMDVDQENPSSERTESGAYSVAVPQTGDIQQVSPPKELPFVEPQPVAAPSNGPPIERQTPGTDHRSPLVKGPFSNDEIPLSPSAPFCEAVSDEGQPMDVATPASDSESLRSEPQSDLEPTLSQSPRMPHLQGPILPPLVNALDPPLNLNFRISHTRPTQPQRPGPGGDQRRFDKGMAVLHSTQGKPFSHIHTIDISLGESVFFKVSKWVKRRSCPSEASQGICILLACYHLPELLDNVELENGRSNVETWTSQSSCSWPSSNRLSLYIKSGDKYTAIPLSPPLFLTPNQCVDISSLMKPGNNTLEIRQTDDLSEYLVVLHAHRPTRAQLAELDVVKGADERWRRFLDVLSGRVVMH